MSSSQKRIVLIVQLKEVVLKDCALYSAAGRCWSCSEKHCCVVLPNW